MPVQDYKTKGSASTTPTLNFGTSIWGISEADFNRLVTVNQHTAPYHQWSGVMDQTQTVSDQAKVGDLLDQFDDLPDLAKLQWAMVLNGYDTRNPKKIDFGNPDPASRRAYGKLVQTAITERRSIADLLGGVDVTPESIGAAIAGTGGSTRTNVIQHRAPTDLEAAALEGFQKAYGRGASKKEADAFIAGYRQRETASQPETAGGGTFNVTDPGSPAVAAEAFARSQNPELAQAHDKLGIFNMMLQSLGVSG